MTLLVAGNQRVDAGKTTFSVGLVARTGAVGFKPRAGNDRWFDRDDVAGALAEGRLYGKDAARLATATPGDLPPEQINPVHRLWQPAPGPGTGLLGQDHRVFVLDRVGEHWVRNGTVDLPADVREGLPLETGADKVATVGSVGELNEVTGRLHLPAMERVADRIAAVDRAIVESYGDVARPLGEIRPDAVAVVEPGRARVYDGERYRKACEVATGSPRDGQLEERVENVVTLLEPASRVTLPPLGSDKLADPGRIADAYEHAYDDILSVAGWT